MELALKIMPVTALMLPQSNRGLSSDSGSDALGCSRIDSETVFDASGFNLANLAATVTVKVPKEALILLFSPA